MTLVDYLKERTATGLWRMMPDWQQEHVVGETASQVASQIKSVVDPFLHYLYIARIPVLTERQKNHAKMFNPISCSSQAMDAVVSLIGRMHAYGIILRRFEEQLPHGTLSQREDAAQKYFALVRKKAVVAAPQEFARVDDAYLEKYFGNRPENDMQRYKGICNEILFDLSLIRGGIGGIIDPTPVEHYQNEERARRAEMYLSAFRKACPDPKFALIYGNCLQNSAFPQFRNPVSNLLNQHYSE